MKGILWKNNMNIYQQKKKLKDFILINQTLIFHISWIKMNENFKFSTDALGDKREANDGNS